MVNKIQLSNCEISETAAPFIIAEIGSNHNGEISIAKDLIHEAKNCGVSAVKFQTKDIETAFSQDLLDMPYINENSFGATYREHKEKLELSLDQLKELKDLSESMGLIFFSTPFDKISISKLESLNQEIYKISSFHLNDHELIKEVCKTKKPIIISTGMSTLKEIDDAIDLLKKNDANFVLLHCVSSYPTQLKDINLRNIISLRERYNCLVGYSGHETTANVSPAAVLYYACVIERHFTLDRSMKGSDHAASLEPTGMSLLVKRSQSLLQARGDDEIKVLDSELNNRKKFRGY